MLEQRNAIRHTVVPAPDHAITRFKVAHVALVCQGLAIGVLGGVGLAWSKDSLRLGPEGTPLAGLLVTPLHGGLLLTVGALAVLACLGRRSTIVFTVVATAGWTVLTVICAVEVARHVPGVLGFDPRDTALYGGLALYNFVLCLWLARPSVALWRATRGDR